MKKTEPLPIIQRKLYLFEKLGGKIFGNKFKSCWTKNQTNQKPA